MTRIASGGGAGVGGAGAEHRAQERMRGGDRGGGDRASLEELASRDGHQCTWNSGRESMSAIAPRTFFSTTVVSRKSVAPSK